MTPTWKILVGDVLERLADVPEASVQCCVTSPPYWGLRDYGTATWDGGDPTCKHQGRPKPRQDTSGATKRFAETRGTQPGKCAYAVPVREVCSCGAKRIDAQIGLEPTPDAYVQALVEVFQSVWRVLKDDGTCWLNLGDSYANDSKWGGSSGGKHVTELHGNTGIGRQKTATGLKAKDLVGIPWRVAFALQADGWYLRSDIIWAKPNPMPESVTDRPTKAHEYVFLLSKSERYYYDADAISELASDAMVLQMEQGYSGLGIKDYDGAGVQNPSSVKSRIIENARKRADRFGGNKHGGDTSKHSDGSIYTGRPMRNARSVWTITTQPYPEAHFATFPEALPERCIKAGTRIGDTVLDPFVGSGTTGQVAIQLGRSFIGIELNASYADLARKRIGCAAPLFAVEA